MQLYNVCEAEGWLWNIPRKLILGAENFQVRVSQEFLPINIFIEKFLPLNVHYHNCAVALFYNGEAHQANSGINLTKFAIPDNSSLKLR